MVMALVHVQSAESSVGCSDVIWCSGYRVRSERRRHGQPAAQLRGNCDIISTLGHLLHWSTAHWATSQPLSSYPSFDKYFLPHHQQRLWYFEYIICFICSLWLHKIKINFFNIYISETDTSYWLIPTVQWAVSAECPHLTATWHWSWRLHGAGQCL